MTYEPERDETKKETEARFVKERAKRELRKQQRGIRKEERTLLRDARGTRERRIIKAMADEALEKAEFNFNSTYNPSENKQDYESDILQRGTDQFNAPEATPEDRVGGGLNGYDSRDVILCENGSPINGEILFRPA